MAGDYARVSYDPSRKWRGLAAQQGRVAVEADWNEAAAITEERDRQVTLDVVGPVGTPDQGYAVTAVPASGGPPGSTPGDVFIGPGTLYVGGQQLDLDAQVDYALQPDWLDYSTDPLWQAPAVPTAPGTSYEVVYLLASEVEVSAVEDPALADVALGGPDTMQRQRILQHFVREPSPDGSWASVTGALASAGLQFDAATMRASSAAALQVTFTNSVVTPGPCQPAATGGYLGGENQMIRVMVTNANPSGVPSVVWGFDDASFLYRISATSFDPASGDTTLTLASAPVDSYHYPVLGQAVEVLRDAAQLTATSPVQLSGTDFIASPAGIVTPVTSPYDPTQMQLTISGALPGDYLSAAATPQLFLRVWQAEVPAPPGQLVPLIAVNQAGAAADTGLAVTLSSGTGAFHQGDFWRFALRPMQPSIIYPARYLTAAQPPDGPRTWACPLAALEWDGGSATVLHRVPRFTGLVGLTAESGCCTVNVGPLDVDGGASLPALLQYQAGQGPVTICLEQGTYTVPGPLVLGPGLDGITLQGGEGVVLQASGPATQFTSGLITVQGASSVTIRGIELIPPTVAFSPPAGSFAGLSDQVLLDAFATQLQVAFGISASGADGLTIADCAFSLPAPQGINFFGAGIYATGTMTGVTVTGCTFQSAATLTTAPFYALAAGTQPQPQPPWQLTFGCLQVPVGGGTFDDAAIGRCRFQDVTVPVLLMATLGAVSIDRNTVQDGYGGFWLVSLGAADSGFSNPAAAGTPGTLPLQDLILVMAPAISQTLPPLPPPPPPPPSGGVPQPALSLRLDVRNCYVDAILADSNSGAGLLIADLAEATGSAVVHGNRIRTCFPAGDTALAYQVEQATVTGNILANEVAPSAQNVNSYSVVLSSTPTPLGTAAVAVTGNVLIGTTQLPGRPATVPAVLQDWDVLNTVVAYVVPPVVTGISPTAGKPSGGTTVTITGTGFLGATGVEFGTANAAIVSITATQITVTSPELANAGTQPVSVPVTVTTPGGTSVASPAGQFNYTAATPAVTGVSPTLGTIAGGTTVTITGTDFLGATEVEFGTANAAIVSIAPAEIIVTSPAVTNAGTVPVTVTTPGGTSPLSPPGAVFDYLAPPTVTGINPGRGPATGGIIVTITGTGFLGSVGVQFGTTPAPAVTVNSSTQITATSPPGSGTAPVTVSTPGGTSAAGAAQFGYLPAVTGISPASGPVTGATTVTITGAGFTGATSVQFGTVTAAMAVNSDTQITATSPPGASPGAVGITVTTPTGPSAASTANQFTYLPTVTGISPSWGYTTGGTRVSISGAGFTGATSVHFGTGNAAIVSITATQVVVTTPSGAAGIVPVTVTTPAGTSAAGTSFTYVRKPLKEEVGKDSLGKEQVALVEKAPVDPERPVTVQPAEEMPGGHAEAFIEPDERPVLPEQEQ
jgi:Family of unknown function (DUF6519)/IPT/TIG domain